MMLDHNRVRLISTDSKVLSSAEKKWLAFEIEACGMYRALKRMGWHNDAHADYGTRSVASTAMDGLYSDSS